MPENQINTEQKWIAWNPSLRSRTEWFNKFVQNARQQRMVESINDADMLNQRMYTESMNASSHWTAAECTKSIKKNQIANWARDELSTYPEYSNIDFYSKDISDWDVINIYKKLFPETTDIMKRYITDESDTTCDPTQAYTDLWWYRSEWEEEAEFWLKRVANFLLEPVRLTSEWLRTMENATENIAYDVADFFWIDKLTWRDLQREKQDNKEMNAIIQYALDTYTDNWLWRQLTAEEKNQATRDVMENPELLNKYLWKQTIANWLVKTGWWWLWTAAELWGFWRVSALVNWAIWVWLSTDWVNELLSVPLIELQAIGTTIWKIIDTVPASGSIVDRIWNSLDEESKQIIELSIAWRWMGKYMKENWLPVVWKVELPKVNYRGLVNELTSNLSTYFVKWYDYLRNKSKVRKWEETPALEWNAESVEWETPTPVEEWAINEQMWLEAGRTINPKYIYENKQASDAYAQLDPEQLRNITDFKSLIQMLKDSIKWKASTQDAILDTIDKKYWLWTEYREPLEWRWEFSDIPSRTVEKWFNIMERYTTFTRDKNILNIMNKVANKNELTAKDMKNMARALDRQFKIWKKWKSHEEIKQWEAEIEAVRQELNSLIRQEVEWIQEFRESWIWNVLEYLDKQQSPQIATVEKLVELNNKVNQIKAAIPNKTTLNKIWTFLWKFSSKAKAASTIIDKMWWPDYMDALLREKNLNKALNAFSDLYEKIKKSPDNADKIINEWLKEKNNKEVAESYWWFVEWEVIEPDFNPSKSPNEFLEELLEPVKVENPEEFMLWEDAKYNWQEWVDYTTPTRVTPEWYPWRYWATSESYKWKPAWDFWTPAEFETKTDVNTESAPKPEFWDVQQPKPITAEDYAGKYGQSLESFKAQLQKAWLKTDLIDAFIGNLEKKNFKVWGKQWTLFEESKNTSSSTKATTKSKNTNASTKPATETTKPATETAQKKVTKEDIDHLFWKDKTPAERARETLKKAKKKKSDSNPK